MAAELTKARATDPLASGQSESLPGWISSAIFGIGALIYSFRASGAITELDTWWHLRLGDEFRSGWQLSDPGRLTPFATERWVPTQWLPEVIGSMLVDRFGITGVSWLVGVVVGLLTLTLFVACRLVAGNLPATVASLAALGGISATIAPRPQLVSFLLLAAFVAAWIHTSRSMRAHWWLVPLTYLWACAHGMWFLGPLVGGAVITGLLLEGRAWRDLIRLAVIPVLGFLAAALTPVGPRLLIAPFKVSGISAFITEWQPPNFREPYALLTAMMLAATLVTWSRSVTKAPWPNVLLMMLALVWTALSARTVALGAIIAAPLLAQSLSTWMRERDLRVERKRHLTHAAVAVLGCLVAMTVSLSFRPGTQSVIGATLDTELGKAEAGSVVFNEYGLGGWLEWRHRDVHPVIDGLTESFTSQHLAGHTRALQVAPGWRTFFSRLDPEFALIYEDTPLALELKQSNRWTALARDSGALGRQIVLFQRVRSTE